MEKVKLGRNREDILGVLIDSTSEERALREVRAKLSKFNQIKPSSKLKSAEYNGFLLVTPNPEQVMCAQKDMVFKDILNSSDISIPDGIGLVAACKFFRLPTTQNILLKPFQYFAQGLGIGFSVLFDREWLTKELKVIRGRELFIELIKLANKKRWRVFLLGDKAKSAKKALDELKKSYLGVELFESEGPDLDNDANPIGVRDKEIEGKAVEKINEVKPHLLFVGFGAPKQEKWVYRHRNNLYVGGTMVVGGTFDYVSGKKSYPPKWIEDMGLEWLWRLMKGDQKVKRIVKAFPEFAWRVFVEKLQK